MTLFNQTVISDFSVTESPGQRFKSSHLGVLKDNDKD